MNNNPGAFRIDVKEEYVNIGGVKMTKKVGVAATEQGIFSYEVNTLEASGPLNARPAIRSQPAAALPNRPHTLVAVSEPEPRDCQTCCFECDSDHKWYSLKGKGICWILLLLLLYLVAGCILVPFFILRLICVICSEKDW